MAIKVTDPDVVHKTELGLVRVGLRTQRARSGLPIDTSAPRCRPRPEVLVQPMVTGTELAVGLVRDPSLGPLVMVAAGGIATDVWDDRAFLLPPISAADADAGDVVAADRAAAGRLPRARRRPTSPGWRSWWWPWAGSPSTFPRWPSSTSTRSWSVPHGCAVVDVKLRLAAPIGPDGTAPRQLRPVP